VFLPSFSIGEISFASSAFASFASSAVSTSTLYSTVLPSLSLSKKISPSEVTSITILECFIEKDVSGDYCLKTSTDFRQYIIKSDIEFPVLGDYCLYKFRVDAEYQVLSCEARFNESNISVDHMLRDKNKKKNFKSTKVNQDFFTEIGSSYGADARRKYELQHYVNMNGFNGKEVHTAICLFEAGFCSKQIKYVLRSRSCAPRLDYQTSFGRTMTSTTVFLSS
jgi:hypothetical protein